MDHARPHPTEPTPSAMGPLRALLLSSLALGFGCATDSPSATNLGAVGTPGPPMPAGSRSPAVPVGPGASPAMGPPGVGEPAALPAQGPSVPTAPGPNPGSAQPSPGTLSDVDAGLPVDDPGGADVDAGMALPVPDPVAEPYVWGFGLGITDVPAAVAFYTEVMEMTVEREVVRDGRTDTVLYAEQAGRGARLVLMHFDDGRPTRNITAKLVWQASNARGIDRAASMFPDYESRLSFGIVQFDGPETYIQEAGGIFDSGGAGIDVPYLVAMGFVVGDMARARDFYTATLGMNETPTGTFTVTDATGRGTITEYTLRHADGAALVLQDWSPARNAEDNPVMVVMFVPDAQRVADAVVAAGGSIVSPAARTPAYDNRLLLVAKDPDGYLLELVQ